jgi:signal peptide peptidase SppA
MFSAFEIAGLIYNRPLLLLPEKLPLICATIEGKTGISVDERLRQAAEAKITALPAKAQLSVRGPAKSQRPAAPYPRVDGVAIIPVHGSLVNRGAWIGAYSGVTSYEGLRAQLRHALDDADTKALILDIDSAGGQAAGAFETAALVRQVSQVKPVIAVVDDMAASAAYAISSGAREVVVTPTGVVGSIGVLMLHLDHSARLEKAGVKPTLIHAGARKVDGNSFEPLPANVREDLQAEIDKFYSMFVDCVALGRKSLSAQQIRDTEAAVYIGADAIAVGLADRVGDVESVLAELALLDAPPELPPKQSLAKFTQADLDKARAESHARGRAEAFDESVTDGGVAAAQARISAIMALPEARGREKTAQHLAMQGGIPVAVAKDVLAITPTDAEALRNNFMGLYLADDPEGRHYK